MRAMKRKIFASALVFTGLMGCDRQEATPVGTGDRDLIGAARVSVPSVPAGYLSDSGQQAVFILTVSGAGMADIRRTWSLSSNRQDPVMVEGIPVGQRNFNGRIARIEGPGDTVVTHEGEDSALIRSGSVTEVRLYLRKGGSGSAKVCVTVEGWPADSACLVPPPVEPPKPSDRNPLGCWTLRAVDPKSKTGWREGHLIIVRRDSMLSAELTWSSGRIDTSLALYRAGWPLAYFGEGGSGSFTFKAHLDSKDSMSGAFVSRDLGIEASASAGRAVCRPDTLPNRKCFDLKQYHDSAIVYVRLGVETRDSGAGFYVHWQGIGSRVGAGTATGDLETSGSADWSVSGLPDACPGCLHWETLRYRFQLDRREARGTVTAPNPQGVDSTRLAGYPTLCTSMDFRW